MLAPISRPRTIGAIHLTILALATIATITPARAVAQVLRGVTVAADGVTPVAGVVVLLLHPTIRDSIVARGVTGDRGTFTLRAASPGVVRLRALRIGFEPVSAGPFQLSVVPLEGVRVQLSDTRIKLATVSVNDEKRCQLHPAGAQLVAQLFSQAQTALLATTAAADGVASVTQFTNFNRYEDLRGRLMAPIERVTLSGAQTRAYGSWSPDSLAIRGYAIPEPDGATTYYAPDAMVLLSDAFLGQHCLQLVQGTGDRIASIGIAFKPVRTRTTITDVTGTLWLDRSTSELQFIEYSYDPVPQEARRAKPGGRVEYMQMGDGTWFVSRWSIRMPKMQSVTINTAEGSGFRVHKYAVVGVLVIGGEVQTVRTNGDVLYANNSALNAGSDQGDFLEAAKVASADSSLDARALESTSVASAIAACGVEYDEDHIGHVHGRVVDAAGNPVVGARVVTEWKEDFSVTPPYSFAWRTRRATTETDAIGAYSMCGIPVRRPVTVFAERELERSRMATVRVTESAPTVELRVTLGTLKARIASRIASSVASRNATAPAASVRVALLQVTTATGEPVPYAVVTGEGITARITDGQGLLSFNGRSDTTRVVVRRAGFATFEGKLARITNTEPFRLTMLPDASSAAGTVTASHSASDVRTLERAGFYQRMLDAQRGASGSEFYTPEQLVASGKTVLSQMLATSQLVRVRTAKDGPTITGRSGCGTSVILDGVRMGAMHAKAGDGLPTLDEIVRGQRVLAVEIHGSAITAQGGQAAGATCANITVWSG